MCIIEQTCTGTAYDGVWFYAWSGAWNCDIRAAKRFNRKDAEQMLKCIESDYKEPKYKHRIVQLERLSDYSVKQERKI